MTSPGLGVPRLSSRDLPGDHGLNALPQAVDDLGVGVKLRRVTTFGFGAGVDRLITWQAVAFDTRGDMWSPGDPTNVTFRASGTYRVAAVARFAAGVANAGAGFRYLRLLRGTTAVGQGVGNDRLPGVGSGEGVTLSAALIDRFFAGDTVRVLIGSTVDVEGMQSDRGGTHLTVTRIGGLGT